MKRIYFVITFFLTLWTVSYVVTCAEMVIPSVSISDYREYQEFVDDTKLPDDFFRYEDISFLGEFKTFFYWWGDNTEDFVQYFYEITTDDGDIVHVRCDRDLNYLESFPEFSVGENEETLLYCSENEKFCRSIGSCKYFYREGQLRCIWWNRGESAVCLNLNIGFVPKEGLFSELIDPQMAEQATQRWVVATSGQNKHVNYLWIALPVGAVVIAGGAAFALLRKKRKASPAS